MVRVNVQASTHGRHGWGFKSVTSGYAVQRLVVVEAVTRGEVPDRRDHESPAVAPSVTHKDLRVAYVCRVDEIRARRVSAGVGFGRGHHDFGDDAACVPIGAAVLLGEPN